MQSRKKKFHTPGVNLELLEKEHSTIHRQYIELDDAILHGQGSPRILEAARTLAQYMQTHFAHEAQFHKNFAFSVREDQRKVWKNNMAELLQIEAGLKQEEIYAALRLRGLCRRWMPVHLYVEGVELDIAALAGAPEPGRAQA